MSSNYLRRWNCPFVNTTNSIGPSIERWTCRRSKRTVKTDLIEDRHDLTLDRGGFFFREPRKRILFDLCGGARRSVGALRSQGDQSGAQFRVRLHQPQVEGFAAACFGVNDP